MSLIEMAITTEVKVEDERGIQGCFFFGNSSIFVEYFYAHSVALPAPVT